MKHFFHPIQKLVAHRASALFLLIIFNCPAISAELTVAWDPNSENDVNLYGVYIRKGSPGPPYDLFGYAGPPEIDLLHPSFTVTGLDEGTAYYVSVTACDTEGLESVFSNWACVRVEDKILPCSIDPIEPGDNPVGGSELGDEGDSEWGDDSNGEPEWPEEFPPGSKPRRGYEWRRFQPQPGGWWQAARDQSFRNAWWKQPAWHEYNRGGSNRHDGENYLRVFNIRPLPVPVKIKLKNFGEAYERKIR